ncbi:MAG: asparagine synthase (glutamine-hydrolyzing) [Alphaproteobacteria bacterium]|nr:asparagine synthase (glutamine-hydrolyzing) [Alphaproteobacteria bacterium]
MCRIFGQLGHPHIEERILQRAAIAMKHGGPDRQNYVASKMWALGSDRLAIQGIVGGNQPFTECKGLCVVFNGEIYNHRALREELRARGFSFADNCDGNVIAPLFLLYGADFVRHLEGMFAIAIVDERTQPTLYLFSDPASMKSVYYHWDRQSKTLCFASEIEALALLTQAPLTIKPKPLYDYFSLRAVCGEETIFQNILTLGPARILRYELGREPQVTTYSYAVKSDPPDADLVKAGLQLRGLLDKEIALQLESDMPACLIISGGVDSSLVTALAARQKAELHSFHLCYKGNWPFDERRYARDTAEKCHTIHHDVELDPDTFPESILKMVQHIGQPNWAPHTLSTYCLFETIHNAGFKVALTGEGSDEFFGGYQYYSSALVEGDDWVDSFLYKLSPFTKSVRDDVLDPDYIDSLRGQTPLVEEYKTQLKKTRPGEERLNLMQSFDRQMRFPSYILRRGDHLSMAHAVEMRVPFCQPRIMDFGKHLPFDHRISAEQRKRVVYEAARGLVPDSVMNREKQAFVLPITDMIKEGSRLFDFMMSIFESASFRHRGYFDADKILAYAQQQAKSPSVDVANAMWAAMSLELWLQNIDEINEELLLPLAAGQRVA